MSSKLTEFAEKLIEFSRFASEDEVYSTLIKAINKRLKKPEAQNDEDFEEELAKVIQIREAVESHYDLQKKALVNSFPTKNRTLTEPKLVFIAVCLFIFDGDRKKVEKLIGGGLTGQKVYESNKEFNSLSDNVPHEKKIKEIYHSIIESYE